MTRRRRWLLAMLAVVLIGAATPILLMLLPCKSRAVVLLNASRWAAEVTVQIVTSETVPRYALERHHPEPRAAASNSGRRAGQGRALFTDPALSRDRPIEPGVRVRLHNVVS